jgi:hypothetical protein
MPNDLSEENKKKALLIAIRIAERSDRELLDVFDATADKRFSQILVEELARENCLLAVEDRIPIRSFMTGFLLGWQTMRRRLET